MAVPSEVRRVQAAIANRNGKELEWSLWYARLRQTVPSARPADLKSWGAVEAELTAVLETPAPIVFPAKKKKANRGLGFGGPLPDLKPDPKPDWQPHSEPGPASS